MTLRFASLGSGSRGNAVLVESNSTLLMVDCGLTVRAVEKRLQALGRDPNDVEALLVTHEHSDHIKGVPPFVSRYGTSVWMTHGTAATSAAERITNANVFNCDQMFKIGTFEVQPFPVPHDARDPVQFVFQADGRKLGILTDTGHITPHITQCLANCDALALECNHDIDTLKKSVYPERLKARIASSLGHLNNGQAAELLDAVGHKDLQWVMALHLSGQNNSFDLVNEALAKKLAQPTQFLHVATQDKPSEWIEIE
ncbi:MAG: MBL fold metallo-hydrolase [Gammaproteobacteria bacterium]|nr:MBL fold metallo-hydrolase [Gammaproteobacteria bacterium]